MSQLIIIINTPTITNYLSFKIRFNGPSISKFNVHAYANLWVTKHGWFTDGELYKFRSKAKLFKIDFGKFKGANEVYFRFISYTM